MAEIDQPRGAPGSEDVAVAPLGGTRTQAMQRLQIGLAGVIAIVMLIGLVSLVEDRARLTEEGAVPEAAPTSEPTENQSQSDPLVEAGVVPDLPATPSPTAGPSTAILPEQGADDEDAPQDEQ